MLAIRFLQAGQQAPPEILDVRCTLLQIGVIHYLEATDMGADHVAQGALGPLALADALNDLVTQGRILEHHQVDVEQGQFFRSQLSGELLRQLADIRPHRFDRPAIQGDLGVHILDLLVRYGLEIRRRQHHHRAADGHTRCAGHRIETGILDDLAAPAQAPDGPGGLGMGNHPGELGTHGDQEGFLHLIKQPALLLLDDQHAHHPPVVDDGHPEEGGIALLAGLGKVAETGMRGGVFEVHRLLADTDITDQTLVAGQAHHPDGALVQALGGHQLIAIGIGIEQIDRANVGLHRLAHPLDDDIQRGGQVLGGVDLLNDTPQRTEHVQHQLNSSRGSRGASSFMARR